MPVRYTLDNGAETHREFSATFKIPSQERRERLKVGDIAKLIFRIEVDGGVHVERMWVRVVEVKPGFYIGVLDNDTTSTDEIQSGMRVEFHADHVIQIWQGVA